MIGMFLRLLSVAFLGLCSSSHFIPSPVQDTQEPAKKSQAPQDIASSTPTVLVPAFSSPMPEGKNVVWCATFQMAWDRLKEQLPGPLVVPHAKELSELLNQSPFAKDQIPEGYAYSIAGAAEKGIANTIRRDMKRLFPNATLRFDDPVDGWMGYGYLSASVKFEPRFLESVVQFRDSAGKLTEVKAFGLDSDYHFEKPTLRKQINVLFSQTSWDYQREFALDPSATSNPLQVILAKIPRKASLAETWKDVESRMELAKDKPVHRFGPTEDFLCPNVKLDATEHFKNLEGKGAKPGDPESPITMAYQSIQFILDRGGASVDSESMIKVRPLGRVMLLDGPFLVVLRKRGGGVPFFAVWVENPEILSRLSEK